MTEEKKKLRSLIRFHSVNEINNYNKEGKVKKFKRFYRTSQNIRIINVFLESLLSESFPSLGVTVHLTSLALQHFADLWIRCGDSSDSNLLLLLCVLVCNVHNYQNQCVFFCGSSPWPFIYSIDTVYLVDHVDSICNLYS